MSLLLLLSQHFLTPATIDGVRWGDILEILELYERVRNVCTV